MPKYTKEELKNLQNPYQELFEDNDALVENRESLEQLDYKDKLTVVTKMILACPKEQLRNFSAKSEELRHHVEAEDSFHRILSRGLEVRHRIQAMADQKNPHPQNNLLGNEFNADLFNEFNELKIKLTEQELNDLVENLALKTPTEQIQELSQNIRAGLSDTNLGPALGEAFVLRRLLTLLQSQDPQQAFISRDFNPALFHKFPRLVASCLSGHEADIAQRLANSNEKAAINAGLEQLKPNVVSHTDPLSNLYAQFQTATVMVEASNQLRQHSPQVITNNAVRQELTEPKPETAKAHEEVPKISNNRHGTFATRLKSSLNHLRHKDVKHEGEDHTHPSKCKPCNII